MKRYSLFCCIMLFACLASAQTLTCKAPSHVSVGESFRLSYTIDCEDAADLVLGQMPDAFEILYGPSRSTSSTISIVNGKSTRSVTVTFTYIIKAERIGTFVIPPATITANRHEVRSQPATITVDGSASGNTSEEASSGRTSTAGTSDKGSKTDNELFIIASTDKNEVSIGDSITLTYKLYTSANVTSMDKKKGLQIDGCYYKEQNATAQREMKTERYNGKNYRTCEWQTFTLVPLRTGTITIPAREFEAIVAIQDNYTDPLDAFFNGRTTTTEVKRNISSTELTIKVNE